MIDSWPFRVMFVPFNASTPHFRNTGSASQSHGEREEEKERRREGVPDCFGRVLSRETEPVLPPGPEE